MKRRNAIYATSILPLIGSLIASCGGGSQSGPATYKMSEKSLSISYQQVRKIRGYTDTQSSGRTLIIPIEFADHPHTELPGEIHNINGVDYGKEDGARENIYNVNFGRPEDTQWESMSSYYNKCSYGKTNLTGAVAPWFNPYGEVVGSDFFYQPLTAKAFAEEKPGYRGAEFALKQALEWIREEGYAQFAKADGTFYSSGAECLNDFDENNDGLIDNIQLVYTVEPHYQEGGRPVDNQLFWAFRSMTGWKTNSKYAVANNYLWLSYYTFFENGHFVNGRYTDWTQEEIFNGTAELDAHTLIHETGHALGAEDYYTETSGDIEAAGGFTMMSYNVSDMDPWTKVCNGWVDPTVVLGSTEITINKFVEDGSTLLIPAYGSWKYDGVKNTPCDEFLMVEFYSPEGLNKFDCDNKYMNRYPQGPKALGMRLWHIDARLASFRYNSNAQAYVFGRYEEELVKIDDGHVYLAHFNDVTDAKNAQSPNPMFKLIKCLRKDGKDAKLGVTFSEDNLWFEGDVFKGKSWVMNSGKKFGYNISVSSITEDTMTLSIKH